MDTFEIMVAIASGLGIIATIMLMLWREICKCQREKKDFICIWCGKRKKEEDKIKRNGKSYEVCKECYEKRKKIIEEALRE